MERSITGACISSNDLDLYFPISKENVDNHSERIKKNVEQLGSFIEENNFDVVEKLSYSDQQLGLRIKLKDEVVSVNFIKAVNK